jgi:pyridoxine 4-dehydrogenase
LEIRSKSGMSEARKVQTQPSQVRGTTLFTQSFSTPKTMNRTFLLGGDLPIHRLGFGAMRLTGQPGNFGPFPDWEAGKALLQRAVELGVNFIDTAHPYGPGWNEKLIGEALAPFSGEVIIATKGGVEKTAPDRVFADGRPETLKRHCEESLRHLRLDRIDLYQWHRPDPAVPFAESIEALIELRVEGKVRHLGLSNVTLDQVREACELTSIVSVQNRYNYDEREDDTLLDYCARQGIAYLPWGPLAAQPMTHGAPLADSAGSLASAAEKSGQSCTQVAIRWLLDRAPNVIAIPGTTSIAHLEENMGAW